MTKIDLPTLDSNEIGELDLPSFSHITAGSLYLKLAEDDAELKASQALRYKVFYQEMGAHETPGLIQDGREVEDKDPYCDHLLVIDGDAPASEAIVGTYRILRLKQAEAAGTCLYTETQFDISKAKAVSHEIMELSRSCILEPYRSRNTINMLWTGIAAYVFHYKVRFMTGCASLWGIDPAEHADTLSYLYRNHLAAEEIRPTALPDTQTAAYLKALDLSNLPAPKISEREIVRNMPPLLRGYMRVGMKTGDAAVIDSQFNTIDVCILVDYEGVTQRYFDHYKRKDERGNSASHS